MADDWNDVDDYKEETPIISEDEDDDQIEVDLTPTPKEESQFTSTGPIGAILKNVPMLCTKDELRQFLSEFKFLIIDVRTKYEDGIIDYILSINNEEPTTMDKVMKFSANIHGNNVRLDFIDLPKDGKRRNFRNGGNRRDYGGSRGGGRNRNYGRDNNRNQGNYLRTNSPKERSGNTNDFRNMRNSSYNRSENYSYQNKSYRNKSSNSLSQSQYSRQYKSSNAPDMKTMSPSTPTDMPRLAVLSITPEKSKLENLPKKEFDNVEVRDQSIFGSGKPREEFIVSPIDLHSGSTTPNDRGFTQDITPSPIIPFTHSKNNNPKKNKQNKKQTDPRQKNKNTNTNKNSNKNQKSNATQNRFGVLVDDDEDNDDSSSHSDNE